MCTLLHYNLELTKIQIFKGCSGWIYSFNILHIQGVKNVKTASKPNCLTKNKNDLLNIDTCQKGK